MGVELTSDGDLQQVLANSGQNNKVMAMMAKLQTRLNCDSACQRQRERKRLENNLQTAKNRLDNGPGRVKEAENALGVFVGGTKTYHNEQLTRYTTEATTNKNAKLQTNKAHMQELTALTTSHDAELLYSSRMIELQERLKKDNKQLQIDIDNIIGPTRTDDRRMVYETSESEHLLWIRKIFVLIYYLILLVYLFTSRFFADKKYLKWKIWLYIILYILYPFMIDFLSRNLISLYQKIDYVVNNKLPRNVYV